LDGYYYGIKNGKYVHTYHEILRLFPTAKFIGLVRDGRAVFHSQKQAIASASGRPMARDPKIAARRWVRITKLLRELELDYHGVLILNYETLIKDTDATMARVGAFLDVDRTGVADKPRDYEIAERYRPELHSNVNRAPLTNRISAWRTKLSPAEIAEFEAVARDCLIDEGYELEGPTRPALGWKKWFT
jgi:hypothetical protein